MMKPHRLGNGAQAGNYYTSDSRREARPDRRDDYYAKDGGGIWWSSGETLVRHGAAIDLASFKDLCAGVDPSTGQPLVRGAGSTHWAGVDCCFTSGKSVSVLWMAGSEEQRALIEAAHRQAVDEALRFLIDEQLIAVRSGAGGIDRHVPTDLIVGRFDHHTTREGDPNLHTHCVVMNVAGAPAEALSGRYRFRHLTIDPDESYRWQLAVGSVFRGALARELKRRFDVSFREAGQGQWEIAGIDPDLLSAFSKRSAQIDDYAGPDATTAQREIAALATRKGKDLVPTGEELEARWCDELATLAIDPWAQALAKDHSRFADHEPDVDRDRPFDPPEIPADGFVARAASQLFTHESVIDRKSLLQTSLELAALDGQALESVMAELATLEREGVLVALGSQPRSMRWTTPGIAAAEAAMLRAAQRPDERDWITADAMEAAFRAAPHLSEEQREAAQELLTRHGVSIVEAGAGTGKTTMASAIVDAARRSGLEVIGLASQWMAADEFASSTGIAAQSIARWRHDRASGSAPPMNDASLIIVDEAGMVGTRDMAAVLTAAQEAGAKVWLLGDRKQLASVSAGSALRAVAQVVERSAVMSEVRRQQVDWQRAATVIMARGDSETGLRAYAMNDRLELISGSDAAQDRVIARWQEQRSLHGDDVIIVTARNADASSLNRKARRALRSEGKLGPDLVELPTIDRSGKAAKLALAVGDRIRFGETLPQHGIRNGHQATIESVTRDDAGQIIISFSHQDGRKLSLPWSSLAREPRFRRKPTAPRIVSGIAGTAYAVQGRTASATIFYLANATDAREIYVGLSRHRHDARIVVERDRLDALCRQRQADSRLPASTEAVREKLFGEAARYREKSNVIDFVEDQPSFIRDGVIRQMAERLDMGTSRATRAARRLLEVVSWLRLDRLSLIWPALARQLMLNHKEIRTTTDDLVSSIKAHLGKVPSREKLRERGIDR
ncbi:conjugal transfer protein [Bosea sp. AAP35]|uniref:MobF family relaxase n=1 Tax=Bosea sp. AAP35 TaxID=1523417 RepID=UPI0006B955D1|nr:MobF family relaxase [Bosea sp. AAP35]KPF67278.1 conjugal transfer protein [Bosea sp. AAP35]